MVGNGFCDDDTNYAECDYDGGDCCGYNITSERCTECTCFHQETCLSGVTHAFVGDGICNDDTNIAECDYDGGDCCGICVVTDHCENCACLAGVLDNGITNPLVGDGVCNDITNIVECDYDGGDCCPNSNMDDGICNDETNHFGCNYDGGDCCVNVNIDSCSDCNCLASGVITSPGFPENYDDNLDLSWLIQVQMGQVIEINFLSFDVEPEFSCE